MKMYTPQGKEAEVAPNQVQILLAAGWTKEKKVMPRVETPVVRPDGEESEEKKIKRILKPKE